MNKQKYIHKFFLFFYTFLWCNLFNLSDGYESNINVIFQKKINKNESTKTLYYF